MAITLTLVERTPQRLRFLAVADGQGQGDLDVTAITNKLVGGTENTDLARAIEAVSGMPIAKLVNTPATSQVIARRIFNGDGLIEGTGGENHVPRGSIHVFPRNSIPSPPGYWSADADDGGNVDPGSEDRPVIVITGPNFQNAACYVELEYQHSVSL